LPAPPLPGGLMPERGTAVMERRDGGMAQAKGFVSLPLLNIGEAAAYLGVGRSTIYQLIESGEIMAVRVGRGVRIEKRSLDDLRARGRLF
jgi:excisionase family DNA binding protein